MLAPYEQPSCDAFYKSICFAIQFIIIEKSSECDNEQLKKEIDNEDLFNSLSAVEETLELDLDIRNFDNQCFAVNSILKKKKKEKNIFTFKKLQSSDEKNIHNYN